MVTRVDRTPLLMIGVGLYFLAIGVSWAFGHSPIVDMFGGSAMTLGAVVFFKALQ